MVREEGNFTAPLQPISRGDSVIAKIRSQRGGLGLHRPIWPSLPLRNGIHLAAASRIRRL